MKKVSFLSILTLTIGITLSIIITSCNEEEETAETTIEIDKTTTEELNIGDTAIATITITSSDIEYFYYHKFVNNKETSKINVSDSLIKNGTTYTYDFSYIIEEGDDLDTIVFKFIVVDNEATVNTITLDIKTILSMRSMFIKNDWHITSEDNTTGTDCLSTKDSVKVFRFYEDGSYDIDLSADYANSTYHYCYWAFEETPNNEDTIAVLRLVRRLLSDGTASDEYDQFNITKANESKMIMFWNSSEQTLKRTFENITKEVFQPYGTESMATTVEASDVLNCDNIDESLLTIDY